MFHELVFAEHGYTSEGLATVITEVRPNAWIEEKIHDHCHMMLADDIAHDTVTRYCHMMSSQDTVTRYCHMILSDDSMTIVT